MMASTRRQFTRAGLGFVSLCVMLLDTKRSIVFGQDYLCYAGYSYDYSDTINCTQIAYFGAVDDC
jgi:hypothetical protein